ncbi:M48 family metalloprotease [Streptomyces dubilierae]|uniref:M48 family metalloprotease n=1 Tax=Streptomyces dubilierae TaxID=3075533 RepID=A0ABU2P1F3_9ACTN|nr:M48 family metalloprotease [Streptomyces sp. DSM 41921]MDT0385967.1 M48 family metalloprotease [Streptomyces sp. DSM 41921]
MTSMPIPPAPPHPPPGRTIDPWRVPSGTALRFALLSIALLGACVFIYNLFYFAFAPGGDGVLARYKQCASSASAARSGDAQPDFTHAFLGCVRPWEREKAYWVLAGIALFLLVAAAAYWWEPVLRVRRGGMEPFEPDEDPETKALLDRLAGLTCEAGLSRPPRFLLSRRSQSVDAVAFGRAGRYTVCLELGLVTRFRGDPARFRAIVLHELGHVRNGDVELFGLTRALFYAFVPLGLLPLAAALVGTAPTDVVAVGWRALLLVALVFYGRLAVVRARECGADVRAMTWDASPADLLREVAPKLWPGHSAHPSLREQLRIMRDPHELYRVGFWDCCAAGLAGMAATSGFLDLMWLLFQQADPLYARATAAALLAPAVAAVVGLGIWRTTWLTASPRGTVLPALGLAAGLVLGQPTALPRALAPTPGPYLGVGVVGAVFTACLIVLLTLLCWWTARSALAWLPGGAGSRNRGWVAAWLVSSVLLAVLLSWWMLLFDHAHNLTELNASMRAEHAELARSAPAGPFVLWAAVEHPLMVRFAQWTPVVAAGALLWAWPVAAQLRRPARPGWVRTVALAGAAGGGVYLCGVLVLRLLIRVNPGAPRAAQEAVLRLFAYWQMTAAVVVQGLVAVVVTALLFRRHGAAAALYGLVAAFLAGCLGATVFVGGALVGGCVDALAVRPAPCTGLSPAYVRNTLLRILTGGTLAAVAGAAVVTLVGRVVAERRDGTAARSSYASAARKAASPAVAHRVRRFVAVLTALGCAVVVAGFTIPVRDATFGPESTSQKPAAACAAYDDLLGSLESLTPAQAADRLAEAEQEAVRADAPRLADDFTRLFLLPPQEDAARTEVSGRIDRTCAAAGRPLLNLP